jgi:hypothetical protein
MGLIHPHTSLTSSIIFTSSLVCRTHSCTHRDTFLSTLNSASTRCRSRSRIQRCPMRIPHHLYCTSHSRRVCRPVSIYKAHYNLKQHLVSVIWSFMLDLNHSILHGTLCPSRPFMPLPAMSVSRQAPILALCHLDRRRLCIYTITLITKHFTLNVLMSHMLLTFCYNLYSGSSTTFMLFNHIHRYVLLPYSVCIISIQCFTLMLRFHETSA